MTAPAVITVCWTGRRAQLVGETLLRRAPTSGIGQQLLGDIADVGPDETVTLRLDWPEPSYRAACHTLEGRVGGLSRAITAAGNRGQPTGLLVAEQQAVYEAMRDLAARGRSGEAAAYGDLSTQRSGQ
jgi:hypothetical protein